jgi:hypothetical protein
MSNAPESMDAQAEAAALQVSLEHACTAIGHSYTAIVERAQGELREGQRVTAQYVEAMGDAVGFLDTQSDAAVDVAQQLATQVCAVHEAMLLLRDTRRRVEDAHDAVGRLEELLTDMEKDEVDEAER